MQYWAEMGCGRFFKFNPLSANPPKKLHIFCKKMLTSAKLVLKGISAETTYLCVLRYQISSFEF